ncbi:MAG: hypothetical protein PVF97_10235 [Desulfobacterales bacterium]|jgi:hypothetical protein
MFRNFWRALLVVCFVIGCSKPYRTPEFVSESPRAIGIAEKLFQEEVVDVLMIHGMCDHGDGWVQKSFMNMLTSLGYTGSLEGNFLAPPVVFSETELYSQGFDFNGKTLWLHAIVWSPATIEKKMNLCYDVSNRDKTPWKECPETVPYPYSRASGNAKFKDKLMNDCIADAFIYLGEKQEEIQFQVASAIIYAAGIRAPGQPSWESVINRAGREDAPMFMISESLGSKVLTDTLIRIIDEAIRPGNLRWPRPGSYATTDVDALVLAAKNTFYRTEQIYLGANQIPALSLATGNTLRDLMERMSARERADFGRVPIRVAAFSDPNDIFSYTLIQSGFAEVEGVDVLDVVLSNDKTWFGLFERPDEAHGGYRTNDHVHKTILCGYPVWEGCPVD